MEPETSSPRVVPSFEAELRELINRHSAENGSNTPDFILAGYLLGCLNQFNVVIRRREDWYGRPIDNMGWPCAPAPHPSGPQPITPQIPVRSRAVTDEQWEQLAPYAEADANARAAYSYMMATNTPIDPRARIELDVQVQRITIEMQQAAQALADARKRILGE